MIQESKYGTFVTLLMPCVGFCRWRQLDPS